ncbi:MAG: serine hydrolase domain-containing protein [Albidovulum sp.]
MPPSEPNPDLTVGADNKQRWNQPENRRHGFHNAHRLWRRMFVVRARQVMTLTHTPDALIGTAVRDSGIKDHPAFSALVIAQGGQILHQESAPDFSTDQPHSIQSVTKMHMHIIMAEMIGSGLVDPARTVSHYLPWIGTAYADATVGNVMDMNISNDFSEDYSDANAGCYAEEQSLGWRLPEGNRPETTLADFAAGLTGADLSNQTGYAIYKSANTDVLTLVAAALSPDYLARRIEAIADAAGYEGTFHISLSPELLPAFSGGGCLSARDLARFGLLLARGGQGVSGGSVGHAGFTRNTLNRPAPLLSASRPWLRYSNQAMTNGRWIGHAGYGGQFLMVDMTSGRVAAFLSVLENASGYDEDYMARLIRALETILGAGTA